MFKDEAKRSVHLIIGLAVMTVAALFLMGFTGFTGFTSDQPFTYTGKIVSLDSEHNFLTVQAGPADERIFHWSDASTVIRCDMPVAFKDLKPGDEVTVGYYQGSDGSYIAQNLNLTAAMC